MRLNTFEEILKILKKEGILSLSIKAYQYIENKLEKRVKFMKFSLMTFLENIRNHLYYDAPPDPYKRVKINPNDISHQNKRFSPPTYLAKTVGGDWDNKANLECIENDQTIHGIKQRFQKNYNWENTVYYQQWLNEYNKNEDKLQKKLNYVGNLFHDINEEGYKPANRKDNIRNSTRFTKYLEVLVLIDRNGKFIHHGSGGHRLGISRVLDINIPAQVVVRHKKWQELRDEIHNNGLPEGREDLRNHPDLQDILD